MLHHYRDIHQGEEEAACTMILRSFDEFIAPGYSEDGRDEFKRYVNPDFMRERLKHGNFIILALFGETIIGLIEVRTYNHISLLFVEKEWHRRGVAKRLLELSIERCKINNNGLKFIEVNSSPYAVPIYEKLGFFQVGEQRLENGIRYIQ